MTEELAKIINTLAREKGDWEVASLLGWLYGTLRKGYDQEEQELTVIENCKEWNENPNCFPND